MPAPKAKGSRAAKEAAPSRKAAGPTPPAGTPVKITAAKGRPMLTWVGKRPLAQVTAFPAQHIETFDPQQTLTSGADAPAWKDWPAQYPPGGLLFHGDNKEVLAHLLANGFRGKVNLVYIDPPFDSGANYVRSVSLRSRAGDKLAAEHYTLGEQIQYSDIWANDAYLQFMYERVLLLKELLSGNGSLFIHLDSGRVHYLKVLLDEVFGTENFRNELIVKRRITKNLQQQFAGIREYPQGHDTLLWYSKSTESRFTAAETKQTLRDEGYWDHFWSGEDRPTMRYDILGVTPAQGQWKWGAPRAAKAVENYERFLREGGGGTLELFWEVGGGQLEFIRKNSRTGKIENWFPPSDSRIANTLWTDVHAYENQKDYPTEKHEDLLSRIVGFASSPRDIVLDAFIGSGTTATVAQKLGRRWIGCDINKGAIQTTAKRLQRVIVEQVAGSKKSLAAGVQGKLLGEEENTRAAPAQLGFTVWRVNDYDLQIQHNEAVNLASEHLGIVRNKTDVYFDGTLGRALVKITPFDHPLTPLDLEELKRELDARPDEDRPITVVCLGIEIAARAWVEEWNRLRKGKNSANRLDIIELRTDERYGKFIRHTPAQARVSFERVKSKAKVTIEDFLSSTIVERLQQQAGVLKPKIDDWRAMVDCVMIDPAYDGQVFNVAIWDVPERKTDLVSGTYELPVPSRPTTVAVKIIDMLGEEVIVTQSV